MIFYVFVWIVMLGSIPVAFAVIRGASPRVWRRLAPTRRQVTATTTRRDTPAVASRPARRAIAPCGGDVPC